MPDQFTEAFQNILRRVRALEMKELSQSTITPLLPVIPPYPDPSDIDIYPGVDISVASNVISRKGNVIIAFNSDGSLIQEYPRTSLQVALNSGFDVVWLPPGLYTGDIEIPAGVSLIGQSILNCIIAGEVLTNASSMLETLSIIRLDDDAGALVGVYGPATGTAYLKHVYVNIQNAGGPSYCVSVSLGGILRAFAELLAPVGTEGYAAYCTIGDFYHDGWRAVGTIPLWPYWLEE